jgi:hypothetical protein
VTFGLAWLIYPFFAKKMIINSYLERGWSIDSGSGQAPGEISQDTLSSSTSPSASSVNEPFDFKTLNPIVFGFVSLIILFATYVFYRINGLFGIFDVFTIWGFASTDELFHSFLFLFSICWAVGIGFKFQKKTIIYVTLTIFILNQASIYPLFGLNPLLYFQFAPFQWFSYFLPYFYFFPLYLLIAVALFFLQERLKKISEPNT